jgi:hypothetical protein
MSHPEPPSGDLGQPQAVSALIVPLKFVPTKVVQSQWKQLPPPPGPPVPIGSAEDPEAKSAATSAKAATEWMIKYFMTKFIR